MANYGRDKGEIYSTAGDIVKAGGALVATWLLGGVVKAIRSGLEGQRRKQELQNQIGQCDQRINDYRAVPFGNYRNRNAIRAEQSKRDELQAEYDSL